ncbi:UNVERIFIED_ORG: hypothetical protein QFZ59_003573 [Bacillus sp. B2I3]|nr:hypothetical protein [Bacillus sp. B2I3]
MKVKKYIMSIICSDLCDIVKETKWSDRQSYKLDLMVGGEI